MTTGRRRFRWLATMTLLFLAIPLAWIAWNQASFNFATLEPGRSFRSGQMSPAALRRTLREHGIRTVLNLRGPNPRDAWYVDERATTLEAGATQVDLPLSSCVWMSRIQLRTLVRILETCEYPLLFHCHWGSERTGLTAAICVLLRPGGTPRQARDQLAIKYLFVPVGDGRIMAEFLDRYEEWLADRKLTHSPGVFRRWVWEGYVPGRPNREQWPYDPSPLVVVTRPERGGEPVGQGASKSATARR